MSKKPWFEVDREGLAEIVKRRGGMTWLIQELISNPWDEPGVTRVSVQLTPVENSPTVEISVIDDAPNGFQDIADAWTLFKASKKRGDAEKRGRFNLGEKLVLAFCKEACITTTTAQVLFDQRGRTMGRERRAAGSEFFGIVKMTREQLTQALVELRRLIPPDGITTTINDVVLDDRQAVAEWSECLWTELPDAEGTLERRYRTCTVRAYKPKADEPPMLYELGIPVVAFDGDPLHVDIRQKVPLNIERDNVTPSYLRELRASVLRNVHSKLEGEDLRGSWATDGMSHYSSTKESVEAVLDARFGRDRVTADPSDREAENALKAKGYTIVAGGSLPEEAWDRVRELGVQKPAGQVAPTPKPYTPGAPEVRTVSIESCLPVVQRGVLRYRAVCQLLLGRDIEIVLADEPQWPVLAVWAQKQGRLVLNVGKLDEEHFSSRHAIYKLALHEIAHEKEGNHLDEKYHDELCRLGARLCVLGDDRVSEKMESLSQQQRSKAAS